MTNRDFGNRCPITPRTRVEPRDFDTASAMNKMYRRFGESGYFTINEDNKVWAAYLREYLNTGCVVFCDNNYGYDRFKITQKGKDLCDFAEI